MRKLKLFSKRSINLSLGAKKFFEKKKEKHSHASCSSSGREDVNVNKVVRVRVSEALNSSLHKNSSDTLIDGGNTVTFSTYPFTASRGFMRGDVRDS